MNSVFSNSVFKTFWNRHDGREDKQPYFLIRHTCTSQRHVRRTQSRMQCPEFTFAPVPLSASCPWMALLSFTQKKWDVFAWTLLSRLSRALGLVATHAKSSP